MYQSLFSEKFHQYIVADIFISSQARDKFQAIFR